MNDIINVLIASRNEEDQERILAALSGQEKYNIIGIVKDETGAIIKSGYMKPNILIIDLQLSETNELDLVRIVRRGSPSTAIIIICDRNRNGNNCCSYAIMAIKAGIFGFLIRESDMENLDYILRTISKGEYYINASITVQIINSIAIKNNFSDYTDHFDFLPVERNIITLLARGFTDAQMAEELNYSTGTIRNCIGKIKQKLMIKSRIEIIIHSLTSGLIRLEHLSIRK